MILSKIPLYIKRRKRMVSIKLPLQWYQLGTTSEISNLEITNLRIANNNIKIEIFKEPYVMNVFQEVLIDDVYGLENINRDVKTVVDIGGNQGFFVLAARNRFIDAVIHTYEPNPTVLKTLHHNAKAVNASVFAEAVQSEAGKIVMEVDATDSFAGRSIVSELGTIPSVSFRSVVERIGGTIDLLKMDCEGAEWDILKDNYSWKSVKQLVCEYHGAEPEVHDRIVLRLNELGFQILFHEKLPESANPHLRYLGLVRASRK